MEIAAIVFAGGVLLMGVILVVIFRENGRRAAQMAAYHRDRTALRTRPDAPAQAPAGRRTMAPAADGRRPFVAPEISERSEGELRLRETKRDRPAA